MKAIMGLALALMLATSGLYIMRASDKYVRSRVFKLEGNRSQCTGVQVISPHGHVYMLTAAHCKSLLVDNKLMATSEDGTKSTVEYVEEDSDSDLMILTAADARSIMIAKSVSLHDLVHSLTHGSGMATWKSDGEALSYDVLPAVAFEITGPLELMSCLGKHKFRPAIGPEGMVCIMAAPSMVSTAKITHGSSGGPLLDVFGRLVGIASMVDSEGFSFWVRLEDINHFMRNK